MNTSKFDELSNALADVSKTASNAKQIINLAEMKGWNEEELANAIKLLHSKLQNQSLTLRIPTKCMRGENE